MSYLERIADIAPGSTWIGPHGERVVITSAAARHVVYRYIFERVTIVPLCRPRGGVMHEREFRAAFEPAYNRPQIRAQFAMSLANLGEFRVFWLPERRRIMARSISCTRHFAIPAGALLVGTYSSPCKSDAFFDDLDEILRKAIPAPARDARSA